MECKECGCTLSKNEMGPDTKKFCSGTCRSKYTNRVTGFVTVDIEKGMCSGTIGSIHELQVSVDLMRKGWHVFRSLSSHCPCDLIIMKDKRILRVQVTKARRLLSGKVMFPPHKSNHDVLALSFVDGSIIYEPTLE